MSSPSSSPLPLLSLTLLLVTVLGTLSSHGVSANGPRGGDPMQRASSNVAHNNGASEGGSHSSGGAAGIVPKFSSVEELCQWLCQRQSPDFDYGCPPSCDGGVLGTWSKRAARWRRLSDDFSFGFDDYLFMKLLGRDLGDRV